MNRVKENLGKILAWLIVGACAVINGMLLWNTIELPTLSGSGAAQADLELFLVSSGFGLLFAIVALGAIAISALVKDRDKGLGGVLRYNHCISIVAVANCLVPLLILYWLFAIWKH